MRFKINKITIKVLIIIIILLALFTSYLLLVNNPTFKVKAAIKYIFKNVDSSIDLVQDSSIFNILFENKTETINKITANMSLNDYAINIMGPGFKNIQDLVNGSTIETNIKSDVQNKYTDIALDYSYNDEKIKANTYIENNEMYLLIKDYFDKYIKIDTGAPNQKIISNMQVDEIKYLINILKKSIIDATSYSKITNSKEEIDIDGEKLSVNKTTLNIDTDFINRVTTILYNKILSDTKAKIILVKLLDSDKYSTTSILEDSIEDQLSNMENEIYENQIIAEYSLYTSGIFSNIVRNEIKLNTFDTTIQYTVYETIEFGSQISIYEKNELISQINLKETSSDNYDITFTYGKNMSMDIKGIINQLKVDVNYTLRISGMNDFKGNLSIVTTNINEGEINQTFNLKLNTPESYGTANLLIDTKLKKIDNIAKPDIIDNVKIESLTTTQIMDIYLRFQSKNPIIIDKIMEIVSLVI